MPLAILIGFRYEIDVIHSIVIDLYHVYKFCKRAGYTIIIISDMDKIVPPPLIAQSIADEKVDIDILNFNVNVVTISNGSELCNHLRKVPFDERNFIYYSGHGIQNALIMPDRGLLPLKTFRDVILGEMSSTAKVFWIMDCCNPNGLHLPFQLKNNRFYLSNQEPIFVKQQIMLITSANENEKAVVTGSGSLFTRFFLQHLIGNEVNLIKIIKSISKSIKSIQTKHSQTISVYSSYIVPPLLPMWVKNPNDKCIEFNYRHLIC